MAWNVAGLSTMGRKLGAMDRKTHKKQGGNQVGQGQIDNRVCSLLACELRSDAGV